MWVLESVQQWKPVFREFPLPPGEGAAKRRVRAVTMKSIVVPALIRPFLDARPIGLALRAGHLLPKDSTQTVSLTAMKKSAGCKRVLQDADLSK
jgi:hypothetical protein